MMKEDGLGNMFFRHLAMAVPWGIIALMVFFVAAAGIKQQIKEGIQYAVRMAIFETTSFAYDYRAGTALKQNIKEGIEFVGKTASSEIRNLLNDPKVKEDVKEAFGSGT
jgi:hypothetical protein